MSEIMTLDEFSRLTDLLYKRIGIRFESGKMYFVAKRLEKRLQATNISSVADYIRYLRFSDSTGEFQELVNLLTVNETYFFREFNQLEAFAEYCLPSIIKQKLHRGDRTFRIWSAGCSTGEEPYTLAIIMREMLDDIKNWDVQIIASDVDQVVLEQARQGQYRERSIKTVPEDYLQVYFSHPKPDIWSVNQEVRDLVQFEHINLADIPAAQKKRRFDAVFCRNVLIYFDTLSRKHVVENFYMMLNNGGCIFLGTSESIGRITTVFTLKRLGQHLVYTKEAQ